MIAWLIDLWSMWRHPPHIFADEFLQSGRDMECPDTQPTKPGALDETHPKLAQSPV